MGWRVVLRIGIASDEGSILRNNGLVPAFEAMGLRRTATGTWESANVDQAAAAEQLSLALRRLADPNLVNGIAPTAHLRHLWLYVDHVEDAGPDGDDDAA